MKVEAIDLSKRFDKFLAVNNANLSIESSKVLSVLGPSGCGKTTLLKLIAGLVSPDKGSVKFDGIDVTRTPPQKRGIGFVFQSLTLFPNLTVEGNVAFPLDARGWSYESIKTRVRELLGLVRLEGLEKRYPRELSGGQQQRVAIARALAAETQLLLLDEPLASLDATLRGDLLAEIKNLQRNLGITTIYVTHDQSEAFAISDKIAVMFEGKIEALGETFEIYMNPPTERVARFVGATNVLTGRVEKLESGAVILRLGKNSIGIATKLALSIGQKVKILVRPEGLLIEESASDLTFEGALENVLFRGDRVQLHVRTEFGLLESLVRDPSRYSELLGRRGRPVLLRMDPKFVIVLPEEDT